MWTKDSERFLRMHSVRLRSNPLDVYHLFPFAPKSTIFQTIYAKSDSFPHHVVKIGLDDTWSSQVAVEIPNTIACAISPCGNWVVTGHDGTTRAMFGFWNVESGDGEVYVHPCGRVRCMVLYVRFSQQNDLLQLQTVCLCCLLCRWDLASLFHEPIEKIQLEWNRVYNSWSDDGSKAVALYQQANGTGMHSLWKYDNAHYYYDLRQDRDLEWLFSPEEGSILTCTNKNRLEIWDCIKVERRFEKEFDFTIKTTIFSPDKKFILVTNGNPATTLAYVSLETSTTLWTCHDMSTNICKFLSGGDITVISNSSLMAQIISRHNGATLVGPCKLPTLDQARQIFVHPNRNEIVLVTSKGDILGWRPSYITDIVVRAEKVTPPGAPRSIFHGHIQR
jgi:hypothetical protein